MNAELTFLLERFASIEVLSHEGELVPMNGPAHVLAEWRRFNDKAGLNEEAYLDLVARHRARGKRCWRVIGNGHDRLA